MNEKTDLLTTGEFSKQTGISVSMITKLLRSNKIRGEKKSGKWLIPEDELQSETIRLKKDGNSANRNTHPATDVNKLSTEARSTSLPISEFSRLTYLTETGVLKFLKNGRLKGYLDNNGQWRVDALSLELPAIRHLIRK